MYSAFTNEQFLKNLTKMEVWFILFLFTLNAFFFLRLLFFSSSPHLAIHNLFMLCYASHIATV